MVATRLATLDGSKVAVEMVREGQRQVLRGRASYADDPQLGRVLIINIPLADAGFEFLLREDEWDGEIVSGHDHGCDYQVCLTSGCVSTR